MKTIHTMQMIPALLLAMAACSPIVTAATPTLAPTSTSPAVAAPTPGPTLSPAAAPTVGWNSVLNARIPTLREIDQDSIWIATQIDLTDMHVPGAESYSGKIPRGREYLFPAYWCAISPDVLRENMQAITMQLVVNGEIVPDQDIFTYNYDANSG